ncbi:hypothetical protein CRUP_011331 [Coryphaenoides rupestris]|nr:hypothetical protein CRUP_011331 [Coryphaenoides rupestris]
MADDARCWSYLGVRGGRQTISLQTPHCMRTGVTSHELMHALGFVHEQSRADRDNYVTIMWPNIWRGGQPTIIPKDNNINVRLGMASAPSHIDKMKINRLYKTPLQPKREKGMSFKEGDIANSYMRSAITCPGNACLWPKSVDGFVYVPYIISPLYDDMDRITIETGMQDIAIDTCVKFVPRTHEGSFLDIQPRYGCWSFLGQTGGSQVLSLQSPGCMWSGVASHEFMHALGFVHEQSRSDRDRHVTIVWKNIQPDRILNFQKQATNNLNTAYDYSSVMHYGRYAFSGDGGPTIIPKPDPYIPIGQREGPSILDLHKINTLYNC